MKYPAYPEYKDSQIYWLSQIPKHWNAVSIKRKMKIVNGSTPKSSEPLFWDGDIQWVTPADYTNNNDGYILDTNRKITLEGLNSCGTTLVPKNSVIVTTRAPIGAIALAKNEMCTNQGCKTLVVDSDDVWERYIYHALSVSREQLNALGLGTTFMELSKDDLGYYPIAIPSLNEQQKIAAFLDYKIQQIDQLIEKKQALIEKLNEQRIAVITQAVTKGLDKNAKMKPSGVDWLGDVASHWEITKIKFNSAIFGRIGFRGYSTDDIVNEGDGAITLSPSNMRGGVLRFNSNTYLSWEKYYESPEIMIFEGDVLMVKTGSTYGKVSYVQEQPEPMTINPQIMVFKDIQVSRKLFAYYLQSKPVQNFVRLLNTGSTIPTMTQDSIGRLVYLKPPNKEQEEIEEYIDSSNKNIDEMIAKVEKAIDSLEEYRSALITDAVTGKIDIRNVELDGAA